MYRLPLIGPILLLLIVFAPGQTQAEALEPLPKTVDFDREKALLGRQLFFDPRLSLTEEVSCASCHHPDHGGADGRRYSIGVQGRQGGINSPTVYNALFNFRQFWNGRAANLTEQAEGPLHNPMEMAMDRDKVEQRLNDDAQYRGAFARVYGSEAIRFEQVIEAIVEFERALITPNAKFDRFLRGEVALAEEEMRGYLLFKSVGCITCHNGINIGGNSYQYLGAVNPMQGESSGDRYEVTQDPFDRNRFKAPSLRNVALTAPYLHDGSAATLEQALGIMSHHNLGFSLKPGQSADLVSFLHTLTGDRPAILDLP